MSILFRLFMDLYHENESSGLIELNVWLWWLTCTLLVYIHRKKILY